MRLAVGDDVPGAVGVTFEAVDGRRQVHFRIDRTLHAGALSEAAGRQIAEAARLALRLGVPLVGVVASSGADVFEGVAALHGWGTAARAIAACSGIVPVALAVTGPAVSGPALLLGLADLVSMTTDAFAYLSGPDAVEAWTGVALSPRALGGAPLHSRLTGLCAFLADDEAGAVDALDHALAYLPGHNDEEPPEWAHDDDRDRPTPELRELLPASPNGSYDVRAVIAAIADHGELCELHGRWAPNIVTAFATIDGRPVGVVASQPQSVAGTLDIEASQKG